MRDLVCSHDLSDEGVASLLKRLNIGEEVMHDLADLLAKGSAVLEAGAPPFLESLVAEAHRDT